MSIGSDLKIQQDIERLLRESEEISRDWDSYSQFQQSRKAIMERFTSLSAENFN